MATITIKYGPYLAYGIIQHRIQRLRGLIRQLSRLGYAIELVEVHQINRLVVELLDRPIFVCDIRNLKFNIDYEDDPVCKRAVAAIEEARQRFIADDNVPKYTAVEEGLRSTRNQEKAADIINTSDTELLFEISKNS